MVTPTKELHLDVFRPRFSTVVTTLGHWLDGLALLVNASRRSCSQCGAGDDPAFAA